jgi:RNA-binding protein YhbY
LVQQQTDKNKPNNEPWFKCKPKRKLKHPYNNFKHIIEVRKVGVGGLMFNEIKYDDKKQQGVKLKMNKCQEELQHC